MDDELTSTTVNKNLSRQVPSTSISSYVASSTIIRLAICEVPSVSTLPSFLTQAQVEEALETISTDPEDFLAVRNRLIIETIYQTWNAPR